MEEVYKLFGDMFDEGYTVSYQTIDQGAINNVGIFLYPGQSDQYDLDGDAVYEVYKVHVQLNCDKSEESMYSNSKFIRDFVTKVESEDVSNEGINVVSINHFGPKCLPIGVNEKGLPCLACNLQIMYTLNQ